MNCSGYRQRSTLYVQVRPSVSAGVVTWKIDRPQAPSDLSTPVAPHPSASCSLEIDHVTIRGACTTIAKSTWPAIEPLLGWRTHHLVWRDGRRSPPDLHPQSSHIGHAPVLSAATVHDSREMHLAPLNPLSGAINAEEWPAVGARDNGVLEYEVPLHGLVKNCISQVGDATTLQADDFLQAVETRIDPRRGVMVHKVWREQLVKNLEAPPAKGLSENAPHLLPYRPLCVHLSVVNRHDKALYVRWRADEESKWMGEDLPGQRFVEIADGVVAVLHGRGEAGVSNATILIDSSTAYLVDSMLLPAMAEIMRREIRLRGARVATVINSHHHVDHIGGNAVFSDARILTHPLTANVAKMMIDDPPPFERIIPGYGSRVVISAVRPPESWEYQAVELPYGGQLVTFGPAHSPMDVAVWLPDSRILVAGDLCFKGVTPLSIHGSLEGWVSALDALLAMKPALVVPGHGPLATAEDLRSLAVYLNQLLTVAVTAVAEGVCFEEAFRSLDAGPVTEWLEPERHRLNLAAAMGSSVGSRSTS